MPLTNPFIRLSSSEAWRHCTGMETRIDIPEDWCRLAEDLVRSDWRRVLVVGAVDRGKSTFCRFLAQQLAIAGIGVTLLDTDPGQKMLGPPACVTAGPLGGPCLIPTPGRRLSAPRPVSPRGLWGDRGEPIGRRSTSSAAPIRRAG